MLQVILDLKPSSTTCTAKISATGCEQRNDQIHLVQLQIYCFESPHKVHRLTDLRRLLPQTGACTPPFPEIRTHRVDPGNHPTAITQTGCVLCLLPCKPGLTSEGSITQKVDSVQRPLLGRIPSRQR